MPCSAVLNFSLFYIFTEFCLHIYGIQSTAVSIGGEDAVSVKLAVKLNTLATNL